MAIGLAPPETLLVLDTDVLNDWRFETPITKQSLDEYKKLNKCFPALTSMTIFEVLYGFEKRVAKLGWLDEFTKQSLVNTERLIRNCEILPFDQTAARIAAYIFPRLGRSKSNEHREDILIVATALAHGYGVATRNKRDFELIANYLPSSHPLLYLAVWKP